MKRTILIAFVACLIGMLHAQTAEELVKQNYVQNYTATTTTTNSNVSTKKNNYYIYNGKKYMGSWDDFVWVGEIAVLNSEAGSFQVYFKNIPTKSGKYKVRNHAEYDKTIKDNEVGIVLLNYTPSNQFWSVTPATGSVKVKVSGGITTIDVKKVKLCVNGTSNCTTITGRMSIKN